MNGYRQPEAGRFYVLDADGRRTSTVDFASDTVLVGRSQRSDLLLANPDVSRRHAALQRRSDGIYVEDLGSTGGTRVNGVRISAPRLLQPGDVISFGSARLLFAPLPKNRSRPSNEAKARRRPPAAPRAAYDISEQRGGTISNVAGNQHNSYITQIRQERESILHDIAATKTRARWIILTGFLLFVAGFGFFAAGILRFLAAIPNAAAGQGPESLNPFGFDVLGVPSGLIGWAAAAAGAVLMSVGLVLHIVAAARTRRVDRELPLPGWQ